VSSGRRATTNWKDPVRPAEVYAVRGSGGPLTIGRVEEFLDEWAPEIESDRPTSGEVLSPMGSWKFADATCSYVKKWPGLGERNPTDPKGSPPVGHEPLRALAAAKRLGCITEKAGTKHCGHSKRL